MDPGKFFNSGQFGKTKLAKHVQKRLPADYMVNDEDLRWLDECDLFVEGAITNQSAVAATKAALKANPEGHIDPFELLIDAEMCDTKCEPLP